MTDISTGTDPAIKVTILGNMLKHHYFPPNENVKTYMYRTWNDDINTD